MEQFRKRLYLQQSFTPTHGDTTFRSPITPITLGLRQDIINRAEVAPRPVPCVWIMTVLASHSTPLKEDNETNTRSINRPERLYRVYP